MTNDLAIPSNPRAGVAQLTLNRPEAMNTTTTELLERVLEQLETVADDDTLRTLVLTGAGRAFCAGGALKRGPGGAVAGPSPLQSQTRKLRTFMRTSQLLRDMPKVTMSAINGACAGAGFSWACATDLRYAASNARFATAFRKAMWSGDFGGTWLLSRIVGAGRVRELYIRSHPLDAATAPSISLVSGVKEPGALMPAVLDIAADIAQAAPLAMAHIKRNLNDADEIGFFEALDRESVRHSALVATAVATDAAQAFSEKLAPVWSGT